MRLAVHFQSCTLVEIKRTLKLFHVDKVPLCFQALTTDADPVRTFGTAFRMMELPTNSGPHELDRIICKAPTRASLSSKLYPV
jgi:hypothetical protein